jgi:hypothetical protein
LAIGVQAKRLPATALSAMARAHHVNLDPAALAVVVLVVALAWSSLGDAETCPVNQFLNGTDCQPVTNCTPGSFVTADPTNLTDRTCAACAANAFSNIVRAIASGRLWLLIACCS